MSSVPSVSVQENKNLSQRFVDEFFNKHDLSALDRFLAPNVQSHGLTPGRTDDRKGTERFYQELFQAWPDLRMEVLATYADGDAVIQRWRCTGTQKGAFMGIQATNKKATVEGIDINRFQNGKLVESWTQWDGMSMMQQLGALPGTNKPQP